MDTGADLGPRSDETLDLLFDERVALVQSRRGYRTSVDALVLAWAGTQLVAGDAPIRGMDLGCGVGLVGILAAVALRHSVWTLVDVQPLQLERAGRNARLNGVAERCTLALADVAQVAPVGHFDLVLCNPPFRPAARHPPSANRERQLSNFESTAPLERFAEVAVASLAPGGRVVLVYPWVAQHRACAALAAAGARATVSAVRHRPDGPAQRVLVIGDRDADVRPPGGLPAELVLHLAGQPDSVYCAEISKFFERLGPAGRRAGCADRDSLVVGPAGPPGQICGPSGPMLA